MFAFRIIVQWDDRYSTFVARCLETGSVATADDLGTVVEMIQELLSDEVAFSATTATLENLTNKPAPMECFERFVGCEKVQTIDLTADAGSLEIYFRLSIASETKGAT